AFVSATAFGRRISIRRHTLGCRAMYVVASESLRASMAVTSSRTPTRLAEAKIRNGSILYGSTHLTYGAPTQIQTFAYRWTHGSHIWSRPSKLPKAYWCIPAPCAGERPSIIAGQSKYGVNDGISRVCDEPPDNVDIDSCLRTQRR